MKDDVLTEPLKSVETSPSPQFSASLLLLVCSSLSATSGTEVDSHLPVSSSSSPHNHPVGCCLPPSLPSDRAPL